MDEHTEGTWDRLQAAWDAARVALDRHWEAGNDRSHNARWRDELRQFEATERDAANAFRDYAGAVVRRRALVYMTYAGGPNDGQHDWFPAGTSSIGVNERVAGEDRAAPGAYLRTDQLDEAGRVIFRWTSLRA